jgi:hypothetical protein
MSIPLWCLLASPELALAAVAAVLPELALA